MKCITAGLLLLAAIALLGGCASHPAYYVAPPPPAAYAPQPPPLIQTGQQNGFSDGVRIGERDRIEGHSYRPTNGTGMRIRRDIIRNWAVRSGSINRPIAMPICAAITEVIPTHNFRSAWRQTAQLEFLPNAAGVSLCR
jgi:hypothetical protein